MADEEIRRIDVTPRTINIGGNVLVIGHISRMKVFSYEDIRGYGPGSQLLRVVAIGLFFVGLIVLMFSSIATIGYSTTSVSPGLVMMILGLVVGAGVAVYTSTGPIKRILAIEVSSGGISVVSAQDFGPLNRLMSDIVGIIENPPTEAIALNVSNIYMPDLRNASGVQVGSGNRQTNQTL